MNSKSLVKNLVDEIDKKSVKSKIFFDKFEKETVTCEQLKRFTLQYYWWSENFVDSLIGLAFSIPSHLKKTRLEIIKTINSEYGYGKEGNIHSNLLKRFAFSQGIKENDLNNVEPIPEVFEFNRKLKEDSIKVDFRQSLGVAFTMEITALNEFEAFYKGLKKYKKFSKKDLIFFSLHCEEEVLHGEWLSNTLRDFEHDKKSWNLIKKGALEVLDGWETFWEEMYKHVFTLK
jgi:pyrroloquinoline quinone (PQQ) biosynthesis protein C